MSGEYIGNGPRGGPDSGILSAIRWTDLPISASQTKLGANLKPDFDFTNVGLLFPQNDATEKIYSVIQMPHQKKMNTPLDFHVHFVQSSALLPIFKANIRFFNNGAVIPSYSTISTADGSGPVFSYPGSGSILQKINFPLIQPPDNETLSANIDIIFWREDNVVAGDVLVKYIDFHYQKDSQGSRLESMK